MIHKIIFKVFFWN